MMEFYESKTLFGEISLHYFDPITSKPTFHVSDDNGVEAMKTVIRREILNNFCLWFLKNRQFAFNFLVAANPHHITKEFRDSLSALTVNINRLPGIADLSEAADYAHLHIYPHIMLIQPRAKNDTTDRYIRLTRELDGLLSSILADGIANVGTCKNGAKTVNH